MRIENASRVATFQTPSRGKKNNLFIFCVGVCVCAFCYGLQRFPNESWVALGLGADLMPSLTGLCGEISQKKATAKLIHVYI